MTKAVDLRRHCKVEIERMKQSSTISESQDEGRGLLKIVAYSQS